MSPQAQLTVDRSRVRGEIDDRVYGQLLEHVGRAVYGGVYEPGSAKSDAMGFREDVIEACRGLAPSVLRWPGGNFASGYHWRDGIGPSDHRPIRHDLAWDAVETNAFGTEEFLELARRLGAAPYLNLNLSTGTIDEAIGWLEYCNATVPTPEVALRRSGPHPEPHGVPIWGLGNENYGWWQHGHTSADSYAETARECAKLLRWADPRVQLVAVGSPDPDWNWTVLSQTSPVVEYLSLHFYWHGGGPDPYGSTLAGPIANEIDITAAWGMSLAAARARNLARPVRIAVDEWGVWSRTAIFADKDVNSLLAGGLSARSGIDTRFEEAYDLKDALAVATWLHVLWRHPEKIGLATQAQMVNVLAPVTSHPDGVVRHTVYWPLAIARQVAGTHGLDLQVRTDAIIGAGGVPGIADDALLALDAGGTIDPSTGRVHLSLVNRLPDSELVVRLQGIEGPARLVTLWHPDAYAGNDATEPDRVTPSEDKVDLLDEIVLPPHSHVTLSTV